MSTESNFVKLYFSLKIIVNFIYLPSSYFIYCEVYFDQWSLVNTMPAEACKAAVHGGALSSIVEALWPLHNEPESEDERPREKELRCCSHQPTNIRHVHEFFFNGPGSSKSESPIKIGHARLNQKAIVTQPQGDRWGRGLLNCQYEMQNSTSNRLQRSAGWAI